jgi:hypothetical protein
MIHRLHGLTQIFPSPTTNPQKRPPIVDLLTTRSLRSLKDAKGHEEKYFWF